MKRSPHDDLEIRLLTELRGMAGPYQRALALMESIVPHSPPSSTDAATCLARLHPLMEQVKAMEQSLAPLRRQWMDRGVRPGAELRGVLKQHEELLGALIGRMNAMESQLNQTRRELAPAVDTFVRHQRMQKAYQQHAK